jgi:hypothetical protein
MKSVLSSVALAVSYSLLAAQPLQAAAPFPIQPGERVLFMGDTLLEREGAAAALESRMARRFAQTPFITRNLSFSADLPTGVSRASFDPAATGMERVRTQLELVKPTVAVLGFALTSTDNGAFGMNTPAYFAMDNLAVVPIPEPSAAWLLAGGIGILGLAVRRRAASA